MTSSPLVASPVVPDHMMSIPIAAVPAKSRSQIDLNPRRMAFGSQLLDASVVRTLKVGEDKEVYLVFRKSGFSVLKITGVSPLGESADTIRSRLNHEAAFLAHLNGSPAPKLLDKGELEKRVYLETEHIDGVDAATTAAACRKRGGTEGQEMLLRLAQTIGRTYAVLHERGILHGDVQPGHVLIRRDGTAVLLDFGFARPAVSQTSLPTPPERGGLPFFFEPEMARVALARLPSMPTSGPGEQHAVAALIYFLITGAHWQNFRLGWEAMLEDIATLHPLSFHERGIESWPEMEAVLGRALSKLPDARFPSMSAFSLALDCVPMPSMANVPSCSYPFSKPLERALANAALKPMAPVLHGSTVLITPLSSPISC